MSSARGSETLARRLGAGPLGEASAWALALALTACVEGPAARPHLEAPRAGAKSSTDAPPPLPLDLDTPPAPRTSIGARPAPELPALTRHELASGLVVGHAPLPGAEMFSVSLVIEAGALDDRPGVAELFATQIAAGAASEHTGPKDFLAAAARWGELDVTVQAHRVVFTLEASPDELPDALRHLGQLVARPVMNGTRFTLARDRAVQHAEAASRDDVRGTALELASRALLGDGDPTSRLALRATRSELTRVRHSDVGTFHQRHVHPKRAWVLVVGPSVKALDTQVQTAFAALGKRKQRKLHPLAPRPQLTGMPPTAPRRVYLIDAPQSDTVRVFAVRARVHASPADEDALTVLAKLLPPPAEMLPRAGGWLLVCSESAPVKQAPLATLAAVTDLDGLVVDDAAVDRAKRQESHTLELLADDPFELASWLLGVTARRLPDDHGHGIGARIAAVQPDHVSGLLGSTPPTRLVVVVADGDQTKEALRAVGEVWTVDPRRGYDVVEKLSFAPADDAGGGLR